MDALTSAINTALERMQDEMLATARRRLKDNTVVANSFDEVASILESATAEKGGGKFVMTHVKDDPACDARIKELKASVRCVPLVDEYDGPGKCIVTGEEVAAAGGGGEGLLGSMSRRAGTRRCVDRDCGAGTPACRVPTHRDAWSVRNAR